MKQGEIYDLKLDRAGKIGRPHLTVSTDKLNKGYDVIVVPFNGSDFETKRRKPFCVEFFAGELKTCTDIYNWVEEQIT